MKALVTGASSGMGKDMALYLSNLGYDLYLVSRDYEKIEVLFKDVKTKVTNICLDLSDKDNCYKLYEMLKDENIDILVNNAGFGDAGRFIETSLDKELNMIDVNVRAYHILTKLFLKDFVEKDKGYILNVASSAGFMAGPRLSTYYATKNYVLKLTMAINEELRQSGSNVVVSALCPGPVNTNFNKVAMGEFSIKEASPKYVAEYAIDKMFKKKMIIVPTLRIKLGIFLLRLIPYRLQLIYCYHIQGKKLGIKKK